MRQIARSIAFIAFAVLVLSALPGQSQTTAEQGGATTQGAVETTGVPEAQALPRKSARSGGVLDWIRDRQADLNKALADSVRQLKAEGSLWAAWVLGSIGFLYGVFHAAGPGHGKAVISAYVLASERAVRRGVLLAFISSAFQAVSAIVLVSAFAVLFRVSGLQINSIGNQLETASYALVALFGAWLLIMQVRPLFVSAPVRGTGGDHHHHDHGHGHEHSHGHHGSAGHAHWGHAHLPGPEALDGKWSWGKALALSFAVGLRPCTGALLVLVFAFSQGIYWAGIGATFAMALGTAMTVSALASLAIGSRELATRLAGGAWATRIETLAGIAGATLILVLGLLFLFASLEPRRPF